MGKIKDFFNNLINQAHGKKKFDTVDESSEESFPASDPPAWSTKEPSDIQHVEDDPNNPASILVREHKIIMKVIYTMLDMTEQLQNNTVVDKELLLNIAEFFHHFVVLCHHKKEDTVLFPALEKSGINLANTPFLAIKEDHAGMNELIDEFEKAAELYAANDAAGKAKLCDISKQIEDLYPSVMLKEESFIFPLLKNLNYNDHKSLIEHFEKINNSIGPQLYDRFMNFSNQMS